MKTNKCKARFGQLLLLIGISTIVGFSQTALQHEYDIDDLPFDVEMRRLDVAAKTLKLDPSKFVYLIGFNKEGTRKSTS